MKLLSATALLALALPACDINDDALGCTTEARAGLNLSASDEATGEPVCPFTVEVVSGDSTETLTGSATGLPGCQVATAFERPGVYRLTFSAAGYQTEVVEDVVVKDGRCHVEGVVLDVPLTAL